MLWNSIYRVLLLAVALCYCPWATAQTVVLHYFSRPPYFTDDEDKPGGLVGAPVLAAFKDSGISFETSKMPFSRQIMIIQGNQGFDCVLGWFKTPEREQFAKFTKPVFRDKEKIALTAADNPYLKGEVAIEDLLADKNITLLVKQGFSYGDDIDRMFEKYQTIRRSVAVESTQMLKMIAAKHVDYMLITPEEATPAILNAGLALDQFRMVKINHLPKPEYRYIMCSKRVPDEIIDKLNASIKFKP